MPHRPIYPGGARSLKVHLDRLGQLLDALGDRLRDGVARAVGETVARSVTGALRDAFGERSAPPSSEYGRTQQGWYDERDDADYWPRPEPYERDPYADDDDDEPATHRSQGDSTQSWRHWRLALALACQAAVWWLRGQVTRYPIRAALGVGLTSAVAAYLGGPLVAAGAGLGGSALSLGWLAELIGSAAALLLALQRL
jgi:hypothetical protein